MKLENLLNTIELVQNDERIINEIFKEKLNELRLLQEKTETRKDNIVICLFPKELENIISKLTYSPSYEERKIKAIRVKLQEDELLVYWFNSIRLEINNKECNIRDKFSEIFDWWSNKEYRDSHMIRRFELLKKENFILDIIENNITVIYEGIAKRFEQNTIKERQSNINSLTKFNTPIEHSTKNQTITITIQIEE